MASSRAIYDKFANQRLYNGTHLREVRDNANDHQVQHGCDGSD
jgi:hypothetical protein